MTKFNNQSVRDLAWAIASPPLVSRLTHRCAWPDSRWYRQLYEESLPWLMTLDVDSSELDSLLSEQKDRRLGKYFETLWLFWLLHSPRFELLEHSVQIIIDGETLGEIDFIVFDRTTKLTQHWEMAVKFYLGEGDTGKMQNWHGPNAHDRLDIKVDHLLHRQSMIDRDQRVVQWLEHNGIKIDQCAVILKGRLYYPWQIIEQITGRTVLLDAVAPPRCSPELEYGCWFRQQAFYEVFDDSERFVPLINRGWMEKIPTSEIGENYSKLDINETVSNKILRYPLHVLLCNPYHNLDRAFIVGDRWPVIAV